MSKPHRHKQTALRDLSKRFYQAMKTEKEDQQVNKYIKQMITAPDKVITLPPVKKRHWWQR